MIQQRCYTVKDLQTILGVSRGTVYQLMKRKEFRWFQIGNGRYRISRKSFDEWLDKNS
ncbi:MAG: helix-turn-helix domain-containing protein [Butyrivibrio sp.]|nr:helix-turn-helix domain-containing protein [Butyrivibrio sp.]MBR3429070.1 helix-turn-helix domain-containing protein [Clostridia bacterium]